MNTIIARCIVATAYAAWTAWVVTPMVRKAIENKKKWKQYNFNPSLYMGLKMLERGDLAGASYIHPNHDIITKQ